MTFLAYLHTFLHPLFLWIGNLFREGGFLDDWQTLIGAIIGASIPLAFYFFQKWHEELKNKNSEKKEALRLVEIGMTQTIQSTILWVEQMEGFIDRVNKIITIIKDIDDDVSYSLQPTNFPAIADISLNTELIKLKTGSDYLHNKLLWIEHYVKLANAAIPKFDRDYSFLLEMNRLIIDKGVPPRKQRQDFIYNLSGFIEMVVKLVHDTKQNGLKTMMNARLYNRKLRAKIKSKRKIIEDEDFSQIDKELEVNVNNEIEKIYPET